MLAFKGLNIQAQLSFCGGNSGDPIFTETFGDGTGDVPLPSNTTNYAYANGRPNDGFYTVSNFTDYFGWFDIEDHTVNDTNGRMLIINADFTSGEFYRTTINGLCENSSYEFSSWMVNLSPSSDCGGSPIPINVKFEIWDNTNTNLLASGDTGNIAGTVSPNWQQYALVFQTLPSQTSVILKMLNNGVGGCGNDLAIDDIVFKSCGDAITVSDGTNSSISLCSTQTPYNNTINASPDGSVFGSTLYYQWQESGDGIIWSDIVGATNQSFIISGLATTTYYRTKVAESPTSLNNSLCNTLSDVFQVAVTQATVVPTIACWETVTFNTMTCSWDITGTQPIQPTTACYEMATFNISTCVWDVSGTQPTQPVLDCWEAAMFNGTTCLWDVTGTQPVAPIGLECWETTSFNTTTCNWDIMGTQPLAPTGLLCWESTTFNNTTCTWEVMGSQPIQPSLECWEILTFNTTTCVWDITGTQPTTPMSLQCWETTAFNNTTCSWDITGTKPIQPATACYEMATFNTITCVWDITGFQPDQPMIECWQTAMFNNSTCNWDVTGMQPAAPTGLQCWQTTTFNNTTCTWDVAGIQPEKELDVSFCENETINLFPNISGTNPIYIWSTGEMTESIIVDTAGIYDVEISDNGCLIVKNTYNVIQLDTPIISTIDPERSNIIVTTSNTGDFLYSLNGINYQSGNTFFNVKGGLYTVYVKERNCLEIVTAQYLHFYIPQYFTPNNDGVHDTFDLCGIEFFSSSEVSIFDRYGKLLKYSKNTLFSWNGTFNNEILQSDDYWYVIFIEGQKFTGHFTLKR